MKHAIGFILVFIYASSLCAQHNLVKNPSFEEFVNCPITPTKIHDLKDWFMPNYYISTDYYHACASDIYGDGYHVPKNYWGYQYAYHGEAYIGIGLMVVPLPPSTLSNLREYIEIKLSEPLKKGMPYRVEFYVSLADSLSSFGSNNLGVLFTKDSLLTNSPQKVIIDTPQVKWDTYIITDTANWIHFSKEFTAEGGEQFLTIGNFSVDADNDTIWLGSSFYPDKPYGSCYAYIDMVSVRYCGPDTTPVLPKKISIYPNPVTSEITIEYQNISFFESHLSLYDIFGRKVFDSPIFETTENKAIIDISTLSAGTYLYHVRANNGMWEKGKLVKI